MAPLGRSESKIPESKGWSHWHSHQVSVVVQPSVVVVAAPPPCLSLTDRYNTKHRTQNETPQGQGLRVSGSQGLRVRVRVRIRVTGSGSESQGHRVRVSQGSGSRNLLGVVDAIERLGSSPHVPLPFFFFNGTVLAVSAQGMYLLASTTRPTFTHHTHTHIKVRGLGFRVLGFLGLRVFRVEGFRVFRVQGFRVLGF